MADGRRRAVFLDRDGTIVADPPPGFLHEPAKVTLLPGVAAAIKQLNDHDFLVVVVTNQSGIARGLYTVADYTAVEHRMAEVQPARALGGKGILVSIGEGNLGQGQARANGVMVVADLAAAVDQVLHSDSTG